MLGQESEPIEKDPSANQSNDYNKLRSLVLGEDYEDILQTRIGKQNVERVADVVSEALLKRNSQDASVKNAITPIIESAIDSSIKNHPERITNVFFPIIGPLVRKAVASALSDLVHSLNYLIQNGLTARALVWRYKAWRLGISYGEYALLQTVQYQVEQIFLIHKESGLLIQSVQAEGVNYQDPDLVSSMLSAITDFANDSFEQSTDGLETLQFGDLSLLIETGPYAVLAFAVRGALHNEIKEKVTELNEEMHIKYSEQLRQFDGDTSVFDSSVSKLENALLKKQKEKENKKPWLAILALTIVSLIIGYLVFDNIRVERMVQNSIQITNQNGYRVLDHSVTDSTLTLDVLKSPSAISEQALLEKLPRSNINYQLNQILVNRDISALSLPYLTYKYQADLSIEEKGGEKILLVSGTVTQANLDSLKLDSLVTGQFVVNKSPLLIIKPNLSETDLARQEIADLVNNINGQFFYFEVASDVLTESSQRALSKVIIKIKRVFQLQPIANVMITQITVSGFADHQGTNFDNKELSEQRANMVKEILQQNDIEQNLIVSWGGGSRDLSSVPSEVQRRVKIEIFYSSQDGATHDQ